MPLVLRTLDDYGFKDKVIESHLLEWKKKIGKLPNETFIIYNKDNKEDIKGYTIKFLDYQICLDSKANLLCVEKEDKKRRGFGKQYYIKIVCNLEELLKKSELIYAAMNFKG